ncbi:MAG: HDOD domain-containing protein [Dehalococcoidia bacterium]
MPAPEIPALPIAYVRALQLMREPDAGLNRLVEIANGDAAFTAALIRLGNSAESAPLVRVRTPRDAIVRLGFPSARRAILGVTLRGAFRGVTGSQVDEEEMWRHLFSVALIADAMSWGEVRYSDAFTAGLLHDIGRLAMAAQDPPHYAQVVALARRGIPASDVERRLFGLNHVEWGATLGRQWGFPDDVVSAIASHHEEGDGGTLGWVVARARSLSNQLGIGDGVTLAPPFMADPDALPIPLFEDMGGPERVLEQVNRFKTSIAA